MDGQARLAQFAIDARMQRWLKNPGLIAATLHPVGYPANIRDLIRVTCCQHCTRIKK
jgi:hypothetical protein